jgi:hypothetical protein
MYPVLAVINGYFIEKCIDFALKKARLEYSCTARFLSVFFILVFAFSYFYFNRNLAYTSDLTGSQARLLILKDKLHGKESTVYLDRIEMPIALFYTDGPFVLGDINPFKGRFPNSGYYDRIILLTKKGRYSQSVPQKYYPSETAAEDGDYILWHFDSEYDYDTQTLKKTNSEIVSINNKLLNQLPAVEATLLNERLSDLLNLQVTLEEIISINSNLLEQLGASEEKVLKERLAELLPLRATYWEKIKITGRL